MEIDQPVRFGNAAFVIFQQLPERPASRSIKRLADGRQFIIRGIAVKTDYGNIIRHGDPQFPQRFDAPERDLIVLAAVDRRQISVGFLFFQCGEHRPVRGTGEAAVTVIAVQTVFVKDLTDLARPTV